MAESIFFRSPSQTVIDTLQNRAQRNTRIRTLVQGERNGSILQIKAWYAVYDKKGNLIVSAGDKYNTDPGRDNYPRIQTPGTDLLNNPDGNKAFTPKGLQIGIAGKYGTLRNFKLDFEISAGQPKKTYDEYDRIIKLATNAFSVGSEVLITYGYNEKAIGFNKDTDHSPYKLGVNGGQKLSNPDKGSAGENLVGLLFKVVKPNYTISATERFKFTIEGIGPGNIISEKDFFQNYTGKFQRVVDQGHTMGDQVYKSRPGAAAPVFITNYDGDEDEGKFATITNIIDWIDFDVQSHVRYYTGDDYDDDFSVKNGVANIAANGFSPYNPPPVDPNGDYSNTGFIVFNIDDDYYDNAYRILDDESGENYAYYVTLQYLTWIFNWVAQPFIEGELNEKSTNKKRAELKKRGETNVNRLILKCDKEISSADLQHTDQGGNKYYIPSSNPFKVLFSYGSYSSDKGRAANYGAVFEYYNWWIGALAAVVGVVVGVLTAGTLGVIAGAGIALAGYYDKFTNIIQFTHHEPDEDQVSDILKLRDRHAMQDAFSMKPANNGNGGACANILINRDAIAEIVDEMGGLKKTKVKEGDDITKIKVEEFFKKLFEVIREASGDEINLVLVPDPDNTDIFTSKLLIKNINEPPETVTKLKVPKFNKNDGSTKDLSLTSKIPKASSAAAATQAMPEIEDPPDDDKLEEPEYQPGRPAFVNIQDAKDYMCKSKFSAGSCKSMADILRKTVAGENTKVKSEKRTMTFPLEMKLTIQGIEGFKFGDAIQSALLPPQYRETITTQIRKDGRGGGPQIIEFKSCIAFTLGSSSGAVKHVFKTNKNYTTWSTELYSTMRFLPDAKRLTINLG